LLTNDANNKNRKQPLRILIYGFGNPGRQDDALGLLLAEFAGLWAEQMQIENLTTDQNYQLNIEDAERIAESDLVIFCDASLDVADSFKLETVIPSLQTEFTMHQVSPSFVLGLCQEVFNKFPVTYQLHIKGYSWEFMEEMSPDAKNNLEKAKEFLGKFLLTKIGFSKKAE
jgi:hydrogenase maturation protease